MSAKASEHAAIRRACADDAAALTALMHATAAYRGRYAAMLAGYGVTPAQIVRDEVFVYAPADVILGFYSLKRDGELDLLFVADAAQGRGIGAALLMHLREHARACGLYSIRIVAHPPAEGRYRNQAAFEQFPRAHG